MVCLAPVLRRMPKAIDLAACEDVKKALDRIRTSVDAKTKSILSGLSGQEIIETFSTPEWTALLMNGVNSHMFKQAVTLLQERDAPIEMKGNDARDWAASWLSSHFASAENPIAAKKGGIFSWTNIKATLMKSLSGSGYLERDDRMATRAWSTVQDVLRDAQMPKATEGFLLTVRQGYDRVLRRCLGSLSGTPSRPPKPLLPGEGEAVTRATAYVKEKKLHISKTWTRQDVNPEGVATAMSNRLQPRNADGYLTRRATLAEILTKPASREAPRASFRPAPSAKPAERQQQPARNPPTRPKNDTPKVEPRDSGRRTTKDARRDTPTPTPTAGTSPVISRPRPTLRDKPKPREPDGGASRGSFRSASTAKPAAKPDGGASRGSFRSTPTAKPTAKPARRRTPHTPNPRTDETRAPKRRRARNEPRNRDDSSRDERDKRKRGNRERDRNLRRGQDNANSKWPRKRRSQYRETPVRPIVADRSVPSLEGLRLPAGVKASTVGGVTRAAMLEGFSQPTHVDARGILEREVDLLVLRRFVPETDCKSLRAYMDGDPVQWRTDRIGVKVAFVSAHDGLAYTYGRHDALRSQQDKVVARMGAGLSLLFKENERDRATFVPMFNSGHINKYAPLATLPWHADDEKILRGEQPIVCSVSLGLPALFSLRAGDGSLIRTQLLDGDVAIFKGNLEHNARILPQPGFDYPDCSARYCITLRDCILPEETEQMSDDQTWFDFVELRDAFAIQAEARPDPKDDHDDAEGPGRQKDDDEDDERGHQDRKRQRRDHDVPATRKERRRSPTPEPRPPPIQNPPSDSTRLSGAFGLSKADISREWRKVEALESKLDWFTFWRNRWTTVPTPAKQFYRFLEAEDLKPVLYTYDEFVSMAMGGFTVWCVQCVDDLKQWMTQLQENWKDEVKNAIRVRELPDDLIDGFGLRYLETRCNTLLSSEWHDILREQGLTIPQAQKRVESYSYCQGYAKCEEAALERWWEDRDVPLVHVKFARKLRNSIAPTVANFAPPLTPQESRDYVRSRFNGTPRWAWMLYDREGEPYMFNPNPKEFWNNFIRVQEEGAARIAAKKAAKRQRQKNRKRR